MQPTLFLERPPLVCTLDMTVSCPHLKDEGTQAFFGSWTKAISLSFSERWISPAGRLVSMDLSIPTSLCAVCFMKKVNHFVFGNHWRAQIPLDFEEANTKNTHQQWCEHLVSQRVESLCEGSSLAPGWGKSASVNIYLQIPWDNEDRTCGCTAAILVAWRFPNKFHTPPVAILLYLLRKSLNPSCETAKAKLLCKGRRPRWSKEWKKRFSHNSGRTCSCVLKFGSPKEQNQEHITSAWARHTWISHLFNLSDTTVISIWVQGFRLGEPRLTKPGGKQTPTGVLTLRWTERVSLNFTAWESFTVKFNAQAVSLRTVQNWSATTAVTQRIHGKVRGDFVCQGMTENLCCTESATNWRSVSCEKKTVFPKKKKECECFIQSWTSQWCVHVWFSVQSALLFIYNQISQWRWTMEVKIFLVTELRYK